MNWRLQIHDSLPSTSDLCIRFAEAGEPEGLAVMARRQTAGRGSRGQHWESPVGNLYLSVLLRPDEPAARLGRWSWLAASILRDALGGGDIRLKWPNDLMLGEAKLAGVLVDSASDGSRIDWLVIGFGANLAIAPEVAGRRTAAIEGRTAEQVADVLLAEIATHREKGFS